MNAPSQIAQPEDAAREGLREAIKARDALQKPLCSAADDRNDLRKVADAKEAVARDAEIARGEAVDKGADKEILKTTSIAAETRSLAVAARTRADRAGEKLEILRVQHTEAEKSVERQIGVLIASIAENRAARAAAAWSAVVHELASLAALRSRAKLLNAPLGPQLASLDSSLILSVAANDSNFPISYRSTRDNLNAVIDTLSRDSDAPLNLR